MTDQSVLAKGLLERIGSDQVALHHQANDTQIQPDCSAKNHQDGLALILQSLVHPDYGVIENVDQISAVGHRVVHGAERFTGAVRIDSEVIKAIDNCAQLAPLHNPPNLAGITAAQDALGSAIQVAVFDTAFHASLPPHAFVYALPYQWYKQYGIRRYGFHGTSHQYVAERAAIMLDKPLEQLNLVGKMRL